MRFKIRASPRDMGSKTLDLRGSDHDFLLIETSLKLCSVCRPPGSVETFSHDFGNNDERRTTPLHYEEHTGAADVPGVLSMLDSAVRRSGSFCEPLSTTSRC